MSVRANNTYQIKLKTCLKMCIQRLRYAQDKQQALAKKYRRDVAQLLVDSKETKAHYRVESLISDDVHIELLEILELYCELLLARINILVSINDEAELIAEHTEDGINEAVRCLVFSTLYVSEIKELNQLKDLLVLKFGNDFAMAIVSEKIGVPDKVQVKCSPRIPSDDLVTLYLKEIARTYDAPYSKLSDTESEGDEEEEEEEEEEEIENEKDGDTNDGKPIIAVDNDVKYDTDEKHPIIVRKPKHNSENLQNSLKIPKDIKKEVKVIHQKQQKLTSKKEDDELEELKKRFDALRR
ncbi:hypothetical protein KAFR_0D03920 [Kazachstania africana CBS 2517]|uniref:Increased sodium tolerance protein 1 n=1 Tax=Kazachstania africana (strain ATCC 22294 / BCRC 22015 / CBS 2517 / CECT 1963 / NBRC 1671 / NRRL Y-8276) TaxID=1071382 RepID=H2AUJ0_KAZAF|nr:hypothetical protein KAFR_0D03920 [Kazachstania africana CBS 2517]CCF58040.1 hypothetical protein KAFR_0D03920 [Kazachstania africana CBS 2517]